MPENKIIWDEPPERKVSTQIASGGVEWDSDPWYHTASMAKTLKDAAATATNINKNVKKVYPALEFAAHMMTSTIGVPVSGLAAIAALPFGLDAANSALEATQRFTIYQPQTDAGQELTNDLLKPFEMVENAGEYVGSKLAESGHPTAGAVADTMVTASPALLGAKGVFKNRKYRKQYVQRVEHGINKAVRPPVTKKELHSQRKKYMKNARTAVDEIIQNKNNLKLIDRDGNTYTGLPRTLDEFSQAIEQTKHGIFKQYDSLASAADVAGAKVQMNPIVRELNGILDNRVMQTMSPETIKYANARQQALLNKSFTATETQEMIQMLNQSQKAFYQNPTPQMQGRAYVDSMIANNLRVGLDAAIDRATGVAYQPLKRKYGALRMLETDVTKRAIVDARKNIRGLIDFSDVFSSHQLVYGMFSGQGASMAAGVTTKGVASWIKWINDPNRIVKNTFIKSAKLRTKANRKTGVVPMALIMGGAATAGNEEQ